jgi:hypothetical protein
MRGDTRFLSIQCCERVKTVQAIVAGCQGDVPPSTSLVSLEVLGGKEPLDLLEPLSKSVV